jgi:hypothetical protein
MEIAEILSRIDRFSGRFEREAVEAAIAQREEIVPELLRILDELADHPHEFDPDNDRMVQIYASFLLAQFREPRAYPLLVRIVQLPEDLLDGLFGDFITENLRSVLASVCDGDIAGIQSIIENDAASVWVRRAAIDALTTLVGAGLKSREEIVAAFATLFRGKLARESKNEMVWAGLVSSACDLYPEELLDDIKQAFADGLVDEGSINLQDVQHDLAKGKERVLADLAADPHGQLVTDTVKEMHWWHGFEENKAKEKLPLPTSSAFDWGFKAQPPIRRDGPKVGRNDPCPCGSGKKYKKCCGG